MEGDNERERERGRGGWWGVGRQTDGHTERDIDRQKK